MVNALFNNKYEALAVMAEAWEAYCNGQLPIYDVDAHGTVMHDYTCDIGYKYHDMYGWLAIAGKFYKAFFVVKMAKNTSGNIGNSFYVAVVDTDIVDAFLEHMKFHNEVLVNGLTSCGKDVSFKMFAEWVADGFLETGNTNADEVTVDCAFEMCDFINEAISLAGRL